MYPTSSNYKSKVYEPSTRHLLKIYINEEEIEGKNIKSCEPSQILFTGNEFSLGAVVSQAIEVQLNNKAVPNVINNIYIESGISGEIIPVGYFNLDEPVTENNSICTLKIIDDMVKFDFKYDGSSIINDKGYAELIEVAQDICNKAGVELRFYFFFKYA